MESPDAAILLSIRFSKQRYDLPQGPWFGGRNQGQAAATNAQSIHEVGRPMIPKRGRKFRNRAARPKDKNVCAFRTVDGFLLAKE